MAIAFGAAGTRLDVTTAATAWNVPFPTGITAGQLLILIISSNGGAPSATPPTGFTEVFRESVTVTNPRGGIYIKVAAGTETGNLAVTMTSTTGHARILRYTGVDTTTPQDVACSTVEVTVTTDLLIDLPSITTVTNGAMLIMFGAANSATRTFTGPAGATERVDFIGDGGVTKAGCLYEELDPTAGATGTRTLTISGTGGSQHFGVMMALRPASTGSPVTATPTAIASAEAFGTPVESSTYTMSPAGIASAQAFGTAFLIFDQTYTPTAIASAEAFGTVAEHWQESYTFDDGTAQGWTASTAGAGTLSITTAAAHDGTHGAASNVPAASVDKAGYTKTVPATKQAIIRGWWKVTIEGAAGSNVPFARLFDGATRIADVYRENGAGTIWLRVVKAAGGANYWFTSTGQTLALNTWAYVSFQWGLDGKPEVYINGTRYISQAQVPTDWLAATDITTAWLGSQEPGNAGAWNIDTVEVLGRGYATGEARQHPILTGEQFGTTSATSVVTLSPGGIASAEAFGTPVESGIITLAPSGIASAEAFGSVTANLTLTSSPGGIVSAEAFGTATATQVSSNLQPTGIASAEAFGTPVESGTITLTASGIASAEAFGTPAATVITLATAAGITSAEAFGTTTAVNPGLVQPTGIGTAEAFGTPASIISAEVQPTGIPSAEAFGAGLYMTGLLTSSPGGVASLQALGTPAATVHAVLTASGIGTAEAFGAPAAAVHSLLTAVGIGTAEAFGSTLHTGTLPTAPASIASAEAFGAPAATVLAGSSNPQPTGIASAEAFGSPVMGGSYTATSTGIASALVFGTHRNESLLTSVPTSFSDPDAFGTPSWVGLWVMQPTGIVSGLAWGIPANVATISLTPSGIASGEAFGTSTEQGLLLVAPVTIASGEAFGTAVETGLLTSVPSGIGSAFASGFPILTVLLTAVPVGISDPNAYGVPTATVLAFTGRDLVLELTPTLERWHVRANYGSRMELEPAASRFDTEENPERFEFVPSADRFNREGGL